MCRQIYLCEDFARGLLPPKADSTTGVVNTDGISIYDACGFSMYTNDHGVVLWGDIDPTTVWPVMTIRELL